MRALRTSPFLLLLCVAACGDDSTSETTAGGGGSGGSATAGSGSTSSGSSSSTSPSGPGSGGGGGDGPGTGGAAPACGDGVTAADLGDGSWDARFTIAGFTGPDGFAPAVHDFAIDADGSIVAAGRFGYFEGEPVPPLLRLRDGGWEPAREAWELPAPPDGFSAIAIDPDGRLALALNDSFGDRDGAIWVDEGDGLLSVATYTGQVRSLAWFDDELWVGGLFASDDLADLMVWDGETWSNAPGGETSGPVYELSVAGEELLVGGAFDVVGGTAALNVASWNGEGWTSYDFPGALGIFALARDDGGALLAGGAFGELAAPAGVARWAGAGWETLGGGLGQYQTRGVVTDLAVHDGVVDVAGCFNTAGGLEGDPDTVASRSFARWSGSAWESLDDGSAGEMSPWFVPMVCGDEGPAAIWDATHQRLVDAGDRLVAGGFFAGAGGVLSQSIVARADGAAQWSAQGAAGLGIGGSIDHVAAGGAGCDVYGLGTFTHVGGEAVEARVVHWEGDAWRALPDPLPPGADAHCATLDVSAEGDVAVGCLVFDDAGARGVILRRDGDVMVEAPIEGLDLVFAVKWWNGALYVAGGSATGFVGRVDGDAFTLLEDGFDGQVDHLDVTSDDDLIATGTFQNVGDVAASRIARWTDARWEPLGVGLPGPILALARDGADVYVSSYDEGAGALLLGRYVLGSEGGEWLELAGDAGVTPEPFFSFNHLRVIDGGLIASGTAEMDDGSGRGVLVYRGGMFSALGGGVGAIGIGGVAVTGDSVWVAGIIGEAGSGDERVSSVGVARYVVGE